MKFLSLLLLLSILNPIFLLPGEAKGEKKGTGQNIFQDQTLCKIYSLQNQRDTSGLIVFLNDKNPRYREAAALAFASVQSPEAIESLAKMLIADKKTEVRRAAAYALGQVGDNKAEPLLIKAITGEKSPDVKQFILEAIGKCGTEKGLAYLIDLNTREKPEQYQIGQAWGIYRFSLRNIISPKGTQLAIKWLAPGNPEKVRLIASHYLGRIRNADLTPYHEQLLTAIDKEKNTDIKMNIVRAAGKAKNPKILKALKTIAAPGKETDYRVRVNALRALSAFDYKEVHSLLLKLTASKDISIAVTASEYFPGNGIEADAVKYFGKAKQLYNWRTRTNMLTAALKYIKDPKNKKRIADWMIAAYKKTTNSYEKAYLLNGLSSDHSRLMFIESRTFSNVGKIPVISTNGLNAIVDMCRASKKKNNAAPVKSYGKIFKKAIETGDSSLIAVAAGILRNPEMDFKQVFPDASFLEEALKKCQSPEQIEAKIELQKTIAYFKGKPEVKGDTGKNQKINWHEVAAISPVKRIRVRTNKGSIIIRLFVNQSPGSVSNFVRLIKENFYKPNKSVFHRVVPNFVIQGGCPLGDGFSGPPYTIGSELGFLQYGEGFVGMASAGKDTEGSQWFITHSPTPHLDGRYTIFGRVVQGMEVVHKIEIGDKIKGFDFL